MQARVRVTVYVQPQGGTDTVFILTRKPDEVSEKGRHLPLLEFDLRSLECIKK